TPAASLRKSSASMRSPAWNRSSRPPTMSRAGPGCEPLSTTPVSRSASRSSARNSVDGSRRAMHLRLDHCAIRSWRAGDADAIVRHANNRKIWLTLRDRFPHPYTPADAHGYLRQVRAMNPETFFAIAVDDEPVGSIGYVLQPD